MIYSIIYILHSSKSFINGSSIIWFSDVFAAKIGLSVELKLLRELCLKLSSYVSCCISLETSSVLIALGNDDFLRMIRITKIITAAITTTMAATTPTIKPIFFLLFFPDVIIFINLKRHITI